MAVLPHSGAGIAQMVGAALTFLNVRRQFVAFQWAVIQRFLAQNIKFDGSAQIAGLHRHLKAVDFSPFGQLYQGLCQRSQVHTSRVREVTLGINRHRSLRQLAARKGCALGGDGATVDQYLAIAYPRMRGQRCHLEGRRGDNLTRVIRRNLSRRHLGGIHRNGLGHIVKALTTPCHRHRIAHSGAHRRIKTHTEYPGVKAVIALLGRHNGGRWAYGLGCKVGGIRSHL